LCLLEAKIEAISVHQIQVISHCIGVAQLATASEIERGMFIIATVNQLFQLSRNIFFNIYWF
jgi:hypothetical protein